MTNHRRFVLILAVTGSLLVGAFGRDQAPGSPQAAGRSSAQQLANQAPDEEAWPREIKSGDTTFTVHQPQLDSWDGRNVEVLSAIEVKVAGSDKILYGAARATAKANADKTTRMVEFLDVSIVKAVFPSSPDNEGLYLRILQNSVMPKVREISLDRFETALTVMEAVIAAHIPQTATVSRRDVKLNPPQFDGEPQFKPLEGTSLEYVANTATPIIRVDANTFYAVENGVWFKAAAVKGPWIVADSVPGVIYTIPPSAPLHYVTYVKIYGSAYRRAEQSRGCPG